jgi:hypothetical protein
VEWKEGCAEGVVGRRGHRAVTVRQFAVETVVWTFECNGCGTMSRPFPPETGSVKWLKEIGWAQRVERDKGRTQVHDYCSRCVEKALPVDISDEG